MWSLITIIVLLIPLIVTALYIRAHLQAREWAVYHAKHICQQYNLQWLDDSVVLNRLKLQRHPDTGSWGWQRRYGFDYSTDGLTRETGYVTLHGCQLTNISIFAPETFEQPSAPSNQPDESNPSDSAVILKFPNKDK